MMLRNQLERGFQLLLLLILLPIKKITDLLVVLKIQDQVFQLEHLIVLQTKDQALLLVVHLVVLQTQDLVLRLMALQIQDPVLHLDHPIVLKIQDQLPLLDHLITLKTNQIKIKILIQKFKIRILIKNKILIKMMKLANKKH